MKKGMNTGLCLLLFSTPILSMASETTNSSYNQDISDSTTLDSTSITDVSSSDLYNNNEETSSGETKNKKEVVYLNGEAIEIEAEPDNIKNAEEVIVTEENQKAMGDTFKMMTRNDDSRALLSNNKNLPRMDFVDVSSHQGEITVSDYQNMKKQGVTGVVVKLTESTSYTNPYAKSQINNAKAAGLKVSAYHYSWFTNKERAEAEATYFANAARNLGLGTDTILVNDAEESSMNNGRMTENSLYFASTLSNKFGYKNVHHYSMASWFKPGIIDMTKLGGDQFSWKAHFVNSPSKDNLLYQSSSAWQWSSQMKFVGDRVSNRLFDVNIDYKGSFSNPSYVESFEQTPISKRKFINKDTGIIYERPYTSGVSKLDTTAGMKNQLVYLTAQSKTDYGLWYKFNYSKGGISYSGWIKSTDLDDVINHQNVNKNLYIKTNQGHVYDTPYIETTKKIDTTQGINGTIFKATKSATTGYGNWYYGTYTKNGVQKSGWIKSNDLGDYTDYENTSGLFYVNKDYGDVFDEPYEGTSTKKVSSLVNMKNVVFSYTAKATTKYGTWYQGEFIKNGQAVKGWIKDKDLSTTYISNNENDTREVLTNKGYIYDTPYNKGYTKRIGTTTDYLNKTIHVTRSVKTPYGLWYEATFKIDNKEMTGWIKSTDTLKKEVVSGKLYVNKDYGDVYDSAYEYGKSKKIDNLNNMKNVPFSYKSKVTNEYGIWYEGEFIKNGKPVKGWVKETDLNKNYTYNSENDTRYVINENGDIYDSPYNMGYTKKLGTAQDYKDKSINVTKSVKTPYGLWYEAKFTINNKVVTGWIKSTDIEKYDHFEVVRGLFYVNKDYGSVYDSPYEQHKTKQIATLTNMKNVVFSYTAKATTAYGTWFRGDFIQNGRLVSGWVKNTDLNLNYIDEKINSMKYITNLSGDIYDSPYNEKHTRKIGTTSDIKEKKFLSTRRVKTPNGLWYEAKYTQNGHEKTGWIKSVDLD
ncbi:GH25 family lysozyme [Vagococcus sp. JNUCC 83]